MSEWTKGFWAMIAVCVTWGLSPIFYHALIERREWVVKPADSTDQQPLNTVLVTHYPHALSVATTEGQVTAP